MTSRIRLHWLWRVGIAVLVYDAILLWTTRYLPSGYPGWLYVSFVFNGVLAGDPAFLNSYYLASFPVPNSMLVFLVAMLGHIVTYDMAGKVVLTLLVIAFPLGVLVAHRSFHGGDGLTCVLLAIPLAMSWQFLLSQNCMIGLTLIMWGLAYYGWRAGRLRPRDIGLLSCVLVLIYFSHGLSFVIAVVVCLGLAYHEPGSRSRKVLVFFAVLLPSIALAVWYLVGHHPSLNRVGAWSLYTVLQSALKPLVLFTRVHGVASPLPPTYANLPWMLGYGATVLWSVKTALAERSLDLRFLVPLVFCMLCVLLLPDPLIGIDQPGTRFGLPLAVFALLLAGRVRIRQEWGILIVAVGAVVAAYNTFFFIRFDSTARTLAEDLDGAAQDRKAAYVLALDWPRETDLSKMISAYAGGLSGIPQMYNLQHALTAEIPETGPVIMSAVHRARYPTPGGTDLESWTSSLLASYPLLEDFSEILVVGSNEQAKRSIQHLRDRNWQIVSSKTFWTILRSPVSRAEGQ